MAMILNHSGPLENHNVKNMVIKSMHLSKAFLSQVRFIWIAFSWDIILNAVAQANFTFITLIFSENISIDFIVFNRRYVYIIWAVACENKTTNHCYNKANKIKYLNKIEVETASVLIEG